MPSTIDLHNTFRSSGSIDPSKMGVDHVRINCIYDSLVKSGDILSGRHLVILLDLILVMLQHPFFKFLHLNFSLLSLLLNLLDVSDCWYHWPLSIIIPQMINFSKPSVQAVQVRYPC